MGIKDSIANLRKALRTTQTNAPAVIDTLVRGLDGVETAAEEENTYITDERVVGKWIDGKEIYEKTITIESLPNNTIGRYNHGITDLDNIISMDALAKSGTTFFPMPYLGDTSINVYITNTQIAITTTSNRSTNSATFVLRYTKASISRQPKENDDKNDGKNDGEK